MHTASERHAIHRRPAPLDMLAGALLVATVVLHVVAMFPTYFGGPGQQSLASQTDQAALYAVLAAAWALVLGLGLTGPHRTPVAAAMAVGIATTEFGFRLADTGDVFRYGSSTAGSGLWLMDAAWAVGAAAAVLAVLAARARHRPAAAAVVESPAAGAVVEFPAAEVSTGWVGAPASTTDPWAPAAGAAGPGEVADPAGEQAGPDVTAALPSPDPTTQWAAATGDAAPAGPSETPEEAHERVSWTMLVVILALVTAGAFLPAWDHAFATSSTTGTTVSRNLGNAFSAPWQQVIGTVLAAVAVLAVPVVSIRLRNRAVGAAATVGALLVLSSQFVAAVVQVDQPVSPGQLGFSSSDAGRLGLELGLRLTGWFTIDALAAYALFAAVMVWATLRPAQEYSTGTAPSAPELRREPIVPAS